MTRDREQSRGSRASSKRGGAVALLLLALVTLRCGGEEARGPSEEGSDEVAPFSTGTGGGNGRVIMIAIDSLHPGYIDLDRTASGPGSDTNDNWLMPNVRKFVKAGAHWPAAKAYVPQATDMNHLNVLAAAHSGLTGVVGVYVQPEEWGLLTMQLGRIHLGKARYPDGTQVQTLFDLLESSTSGQAKTAFVSNKGWVPEEYLAATGRAAAVDLIVNGKTHPSYIQAPTSYVSFYDNPSTDPDHACDPESVFQVLTLDSSMKKNPAEHPRDFWIADAALKVMQNESPDMMYIILGDLDHAQHSLGAVNNPAEWTQGTVPLLPAGCAQQPQYRLVSKRNNRLRKEPILDLVRDVDLAFKQLMDGLKSGGYLEGATVILLSDHAMVSYLYRDDIAKLTDAKQMLEDAGLAPAGSFYMYGAGSIGALYWRPLYKLSHPLVVAQAKAELLALKHLAYNHETGQIELPWAVLDRQEMIKGRSDLGIGPNELYNAHFVKNGVWPDLVILMRNGWQIPSGAFNLGGGAAYTVFNAGHGAPDTAPVMLAIQGLGFTAGRTCSGAAFLSDVGATVAQQRGWTFAQQAGKVLTCP